MGYPVSSLTKISQAAYKPNFVEDDHSSRRRIAARAHSDLPAGCGAPGRHAGHGLRRKTPRLFGLAPCGVYPASELYSRSGALLPHLFTLTVPLRAWRYFLCGTCRPWSLDAPVPDVIRHTALRSSDFPPPEIALRYSGSDRPAACCLHHTQGGSTGSMRRDRGSPARHPAVVRSALRGLRME